MISGALKSHTRKVLRIYAKRREFLAAALQTELGSAVNFTLPQGGLALWVNFSKNIDVAKLAARAAQHGVIITAGQAFATNGFITNGARLGFGSMNETELREALQRLKTALPT
jgi:GntR family transcriptional regulator/MocR family aminotransferase